MRIHQELDRLVNGFLPLTFCPWNSVEPSWLSCTSCIYLLQIHVHYVLCMDIRHFLHQTLCWRLLNGLWRSEHALREGWYNWAITMFVKGWRDDSFSRFSPGFILVNFKCNWLLESSVECPISVICWFLVRNPPVIRGRESTVKQRGGMGDIKETYCVQVYCAASSQCL